MSADPVGLPAVGRTALGVAAIRAAEADRTDPLFVDPFAASFVRAGRELYGPMPFRDGGGPSGSGPAGRRPGLVQWVRLRTRFLDDLLADAVGAGCRQLVILGAGLDARAYRLDWPTGMRLWELDLPAVLEFKQSVVDIQAWRPRCERRTVPGDLAGDWSEGLLAAGFDPRQTSAWVAEGLLTYLTPEVRDRLVGGAAELATASSRIALTLPVRRPGEAWRADDPDPGSWRGRLVALRKSDTPVDVPVWMRGLGWEGTPLFDARERADHYGLRSPAEGPSRALLVDGTRP